MQHGGGPCLIACGRPALLAVALTGAAMAQSAVPVPREKPPMLREAPVEEPVAPPAPIPPPDPEAVDPRRTEEPSPPQPEPAIEGAVMPSPPALPDPNETLRMLLQIQHDNSLWLQVGLFLLALTAMLAGYSALLAHRAMRASLRSDRNSRAALLAETRPWLRVEVTPRGPLMWTDEGCHVALTVSVENIGKAPALDVRARLEGSAAADDPALAAALEGLARATLSETHDPGATIYPGERFSEEYATVLPLPKGEKLDSNGGRGEILGCVTYRMQGGVRGQTGFAYVVLPQDQQPGVSHALNGASDVDFRIQARPEMALIS